LTFKLPSMIIKCVCLYIYTYTISTVSYTLLVLVRTSPYHIVSVKEPQVKLKQPLTRSIVVSHHEELVNHSPAITSYSSKTAGITATQWHGQTQWSVYIYICIYIYIYIHMW
jgi:hypothetical protein